MGPFADRCRRTESTYNFDTLTTTVLLVPAPATPRTEQTTSNEERTVRSGVSTNIGVLWKVMPELSLALVLRPQFTIGQEATWNRVNIDGATTTVIVNIQLISTCR